MNVEKPDNSKQKAAAGLVALCVIALLASGAMVYANKQTTQNVITTSSSLPSNTTTTSSLSGSSTVSSSSASASSGYKDGTYSASSDYYVPHGSENIKVTLTVQGGVVTNSSIANSENNGESALFQESFASEYKSYVVGKPVSSLQLNYVAGASDTTQGFNDALQQIKSQARA